MCACVVGRSNLLLQWNLADQATIRPPTCIAFDNTSVHFRDRLFPRVVTVAIPSISYHAKKEAKATKDLPETFKYSFRHMPCCLTDM